MKCAECECTPLDCRDFGFQCIKKVCCLPRKEYTVNRFLSNVRNLYATALAIEVLYIGAERAFGLLHWNVILYVTSFMSEYFLYNL
jgi:hypothetical protein